MFSNTKVCFLSFKKSDVKGLVMLSWDSSAGRDPTGFTRLVENVCLQHFPSSRPARVCTSPRCLMDNLKCAPAVPALDNYQR